MFRQGHERFESPYTESKREPDMTITPATFYQPTVVFESGWSEPREQLYSSAEL